jgi:t-SNARE complex subunit (syntaxin)
MIESASALAVDAKSTGEQAIKLSEENSEDLKELKKLVKELKEIQETHERKIRELEEMMSKIKTQIT